MRRQRGVWLPALVLLWGVLCCTTAPQNQAKNDLAVPVTVRSVEARDVPVEVRAIGTVEALNTVEIVSQVTGRVMSVEFEEGAMVKKGDPLFVIDTRPYSASLAAAQAELARGQALAEQAEAEVQQAEALAREGLTSAEETVRRRAELKSSKAVVEAAKAQIASASLNVQFSTIRAPIDGRTGQLLVNAGNVVQGNGSTPLVVLRSLAPVKVSFTVAQDYLPQLRERFDAGKLEVRAAPRGAGAKTAEGVLTFIDNTVDARTGTLMLKATFPNTDQALWPGSFVDVMLVLGVEQQVVVAPETAVSEGQNGVYAFVIDAQNVAHRRTVSLRRRTETVAVIESGLAPGERVVVDGLIRLKDGIKVQIKEDAQSAEASSGGVPNVAAGSGGVPSAAAGSGGVPSP